MRALAALLLWATTTIAVAGAVGAGWTSTQLRSEDGFVDLASSLGDDPEVQQTVAELTGEAFAAQASLPEALRAPAGVAVREALLRLTRADGWSDAWRETARRAHQRLATDPPPSDVRVDVAPLVDLALAEASSTLSTPLTGPDELLVPASQSDPAPLVSLISRSTTAAAGLGAIALIAGLLTVAATRHRGRGLFAVGGGVALAAAAWWAAGRLLLPSLIERSAQDTAYGRALQDVLTDRVVSAMQPTLVIVALAGAALAVAGTAVSARHP